MAQRFGGKFSPGGGNNTSNATPPPNKFAGKAAKSVDVRSLLMFVLPTPLLFAALHGLTDLAAALIEAGADLEHPLKDDGSPALCVAARGGHAGTVELLLEKGYEVHGIARRTSPSSTFRNLIA